MELILVPLILGSYFLPTIIAVQRDHPSSDAIFFLNLLLGITVIGWIVALIWSLTKARRGQRDMDQGTHE